MGFRDVAIYFIAVLCLTTAAAVVTAYLLYYNYTQFNQQLTSIVWTVFALVLTAWLVALVGGSFLMKKALAHLVDASSEAVGYTDLTATWVILLLLLAAALVVASTGVALARAYVASSTPVSYFGGIAVVCGLALLILIIGMGLVLPKMKDTSEGEEPVAPAAARAAPAAARGAPLAAREAPAAASRTLSERQLKKLMEDFARYAQEARDAAKSAENAAEAALKAQMNATLNVPAPGPAPAPAPGPQMTRGLRPGSRYRYLN